MNAPLCVRLEAGFAWQLPFSIRELLPLLRELRENCGIDAMPLELILGNDALTCAVNERNMGCYGPTNILSFPPFVDNGSLAGLAAGSGCLLLSLDTLERESLLYGQTKEEHCIRLLAHGMAHLSGLDHGPQMDRVQDKAFSAAMQRLQ